MFILTAVYCVEETENFMIRDLADCAIKSVIAIKIQSVLITWKFFILMRIEFKLSYCFPDPSSVSSKHGNFHV